MVKIITLAFNRPDFLELQLNSLKKWVTDFEYVVYDNAPDDSIKNECARLGIECVSIKVLGTDPSYIVGLSLNKIWEIEQDTRGELWYIDSDMFLLGELPKLNCDMAFVPQVRKDYMYPWTGLMYFDMDTLPNPEKLTWQVDYNLKDTDVGGRNHFYLLENNPKVQELEMWTLVDFYQYSFNGKDVNNYHENYGKMRTLAKDFPKPHSFDMFKVKDAPFENCFILHYKSASNYPSFYTPDYNKLKTQALCKLLTA